MKDIELTVLSFDTVLNLSFEIDSAAAMIVYFYSTGFSPDSTLYTFGFLEN